MWFALIDMIESLYTYSMDSHQKKPELHIYFKKIINSVFGQATSNLWLHFSSPKARGPKEHCSGDQSCSTLADGTIGAMLHNE